MKEKETSVPQGCGWSQSGGLDGEEAEVGAEEQSRVGVGGNSSTCRCTRPLRTSPPPAPQEGPQQAQLLAGVPWAPEAAARLRVGPIEGRGRTHWHWGRGQQRPRGSRPEGGPARVGWVGGSGGR